jgi:hypothetical protein
MALEKISGDFCEKKISAKFYIGEVSKQEEESRKRRVGRGK